MKRLAKLAMLVAVLGLAAPVAAEEKFPCEQAFSETELAVSDEYKLLSAYNPDTAKALKDALVLGCEAAVKAGRMGIDARIVMDHVNRTSVRNSSKIVELGNSARRYMALYGWKVGQLSK